MGAKKEFLLEGLSCANCAAKIECELDRLDEVKEASINMNSGKLVLIPKNEEFDYDGKVKEIVGKYESHVKVVNISSMQSTPKQTDRINRHEGHNHDHEHQGHTHEGHEEDHDHSHHHGEHENSWIYVIRLAIALGVVALVYALDFNPMISNIGYIVAYILAGYEVLLTAIKNIRRGNVFDENFLMGVASLGAFFIGEQIEAVTVLVFYGVGELFQDMAVRRSRKNIAGLMDIRPDYANLLIQGKVTRVTPDRVQVSDVIVVKPGEKIPLDGIVVKGSSFIDTKALTGESIPREVMPGAEVLSGSVNNSGLLEIQVTKVFAESTVSKILELVENAGHKKAESEKFITKFARYYTPIVVFTALAVAIIPPLFGFGAFSDWLYRALSFLIISCPCALVISIPLSFFGGIGGAARNGVLIKGGNYLDALNHISTAVFDKTGTLTKGVFHVAKVVPTEGVSMEDLLQTAWAAEQNSTHPIAKSFLQYYKQYYGDKVADRSIDDADESMDVTEKAGYGIIASRSNQVILAGTGKLIKEYGMEVVEPLEVGSVVHVAKDQQYLGYFIVQDEIKDSVAAKLSLLKSLGIKKTIMLTGDREPIANATAREVGIDQYHSELLPQDKVRLFETYKNELAEKEKILFVGDGINDAPVLAMADVGFAMGGIGSDAAIEAADVVIMKDDIGAIAIAMQVAKKTRSIVIQNIVFALGVKLLIMVLAFFDITSIWFAIFADVGVALLALLNALRAMRIKALDQ